MENTASNKLHFSLVSPERELFSGEVDQVVVPGADGQFGALVKHAAVMSVVNRGIIRIIDGNNETRMFVDGGIVDVTPVGVSILAEDAVDLKSVDLDALQQQAKDLEEDVRDAKDEAQKATFQKKLDRAKAILAAA